MIIKEVTSNTLAPLFLLIKDLEPVPEPFRCQKELCVVVDITQYMDFIEKDLEDMNFLSTSTKRLKQLVMTQNYNELVSCFYLDMSRAVCKELHYAEIKGKSATRFSHLDLISEDAEQLTLESLHDYYNMAKFQTEEPIRAYMERCGFYLPKKFRKENVLLWEYANVLYFFYKVGSLTFNLKEIWND